MVSAFGKFLRNLRMDVGELLLDMAKKLEVSSAFLSGVENGKCKIPENWIEKISSIYKLSAEKSQKLKEACFETNQMLKIGLVGLKDEQKDLAFAFARKLESMPQRDIDNIRKILKKGEK